MQVHLNLICKSYYTRNCVDALVPYGGMAEYAVCHASQLYRLPAGVEFDEACLTINVMRMLRAVEVGNMKPGGSAAIIGGNVLSLVLLRLLKFMGAGNVTLFSPVAAHREWALKFGADHVYDPNQDRLASSLVHLPTPGGFEVLFDTTTDPEMLRRLMALLGNSGTVVIPLPYPNGVTLPLPLDALFMSEVTVRVIKDDPKYLPQALKLLPKLGLAEMISQRLTIDQAALLFSPRYFEDNICGVIYFN